MTRAPLVVLVEDDDLRGAKLEAELRQVLKPTFRLERLELETSSAPADSQGTYEDRIVAELSHRKFRDAALIVTDRDLSLSGRYPGLSETSVSKAAAILSIPVCIYASGKLDTVLERQRSGGDGRIILNPADPSTMARKVRVLALGFESLRKRVEEITASKVEFKKYRGPAGVLAELLEHQTGLIST